MAVKINIETSSPYNNTSYSTNRDNTNNINNNYYYI